MYLLILFLVITTILVYYLYNPRTEFFNFITRYNIVPYRESTFPLNAVVKSVKIDEKCKNKKARAKTVVRRKVLDSEDI